MGAESQTWRQAEAGVAWEAGAAWSGHHWRLVPAILRIFEPWLGASVLLYVTSHLSEGEAGHLQHGGLRAPRQHWWKWLGLLKPSLRSCTAPLPPYSVGQSKSQSQWENRFHSLRGGAAKDLWSYLIYYKPEGSNT